MSGFFASLAIYMYLNYIIKECFKTKIFTLHPIGRLSRLACEDLSYSSDIVSENDTF